MGELVDGEAARHRLELRSGTDAFAAELVAARSACNVDLMRRGFFTT